ncbi:MAG TPA: efflux RND transporter periplasmic adaptor subunit [Candidatus Bathyarchaeia archaeon]|nr:efflux RND transporter periplasmic adaptor subunit [Candidatus Bathyarchaeia archaeon]
MKILFRLYQWIKSHPVKVGVIILLVLVATIYLPRKVKAILAGPESEYETVNPRSSDLIQSVDVSGTVKAKEQVTLKFQTSGELAWIGVKKGDHVKKWQAIASLDKKDLKRSLEKEVYDYLNERWDFEQSHADNKTSGLPLEKSLLTEAAKRILEKAQFDLNKTVLDVEIAQEAYNLATIYSPIDGLVTNMDTVIAGINITPATATFTVANPETMIFEANVDEADIAQVRVGQKLIINLSAYSDQELTGEISKIDFTSTTTRGGGTAFSIEALLPENNDYRFKIGMNGDAEIIIAERENILSLPLDAIEEKDGKTLVKIITDKKIQTLEIKTGIFNDSRIEIISGLAGDEKVIIGEKKKPAKK